MSKTRIFGIQQILVAELGLREGGENILSDIMDTINNLINKENNTLLNNKDQTGD